MDEGSKWTNLKEKLLAAFKAKTIINDNCNGKTMMKGTRNGPKEESTEHWKSWEKQWKQPSCDGKMRGVCE